MFFKRLLNTVTNSKIFLHFCNAKEKLTNNLLLISSEELVYFILAFLYFVAIYFFFFPEEKYPNPIFVITQLACLLFHFKLRSKREKVISWFIINCSVLSSLWFSGVSFVFIPLIFFFNFLLIAQPTLILLWYSLDPGLSLWGMFFSFQLLSLYLITVLLDRQDIPAIHKLILSFLLYIFFILVNHCYYGFSFVSLFDLQKLATLVAGVLLMFLCITERKEGKAFFAAFFGYFIITTLIVVYLSLTTEPNAILVLAGFISLMIFFFWGMNLFGLENKKEEFIPHFYATLLLFLPLLTMTEWLSKWMQGQILLLYFLGLSSLIVKKALEK